MKLFKLISGEIAWQKRISDVEDAIEQIRRMVRSQDLEISDAMEKMQRLTARLAKRTYRGDTEVAPPPEIDALRSNAAASERILARRARTGSLAEEAGNGLLPKR